MLQVFVGGLPLSATDEQLREFASAAGEVIIYQTLCGAPLDALCRL